MGNVIRFPRKMARARYGMFTDMGDGVIHQVVRFVRLNYSPDRRWGEAAKRLKILRDHHGMLFKEAMSATVRTSVYKAIYDGVREGDREAFMDH